MLALTAVLAISSAQSALGQRGDCRGAVATTWEIRITSPEEAGKPLTVSGTVFAADGETPLPGVTVFVYHTDAEGYYSPNGADESDARLCGVMKTDARGRYRFHTIRPASYPGTRIPQHVHFVVSGENLRTQRFDLHFEGDPSLRGRRSSGRWAKIQPVTEMEDGGQQVLKDLRLAAPASR